MNSAQRVGATVRVVPQSIATFIQNTDTAFPKAQGLDKYSIMTVPNNHPRRRPFLLRPTQPFRMRVLCGRLYKVHTEHIYEHAACPPGRTLGARFYTAPAGAVVVARAKSLRMEGRQFAKRGVFARRSNAGEPDTSRERPRRLARKVWPSRVSEQRG